MFKELRAFAHALLRSNLKPLPAAPRFQGTKTFALPTAATASETARAKVPLRDVERVENNFDYRAPFQEADK